MSGVAEVLAGHTSAGYLPDYDGQGNNGIWCNQCEYGEDNPTECEDEWLAKHQADMLAAAGFGDVRAAGAEALEAAADEADGIIAAGDIAECAAPVEGECGRYEAVAARDSLYEEGPGDYLRARAEAVRGEG